MAIWQWGLLLLVIVWALQSFQLWLQMRHYSRIFKDITCQHADGFAGAGNFRGRLAKGAVALLVVTPDLVVRRLMVMHGRSAFARLKRYPEFEGIALDQLRSAPAILGTGAHGVTEAVKRAIEQIDRVRSEPARKPGLSGLKLSGLKLA